MIPVTLPVSAPAEEETKKFVPTNLATCYEGERIYYKDLPTGRCFTTKECRVEFAASGAPVRR